MLSILKKEYVDCFGKKNFLLIRSILCYYKVLNFRIIVLIRIMGNSKNNYIKKVIQKKLKLKYMVDIGVDVIIGKNLKVEHFIGLVIGKKVIIGDNCKLYHNVTIGQKNNIYPVLGNNVTVYPSAIILGDIKIGNNVIISANSVVLNDIPDNSLVAGIPARVIKNIGEI